MLTMTDLTCRHLFALSFVVLYLVICSLSQPLPEFDHLTYAEQWPITICLDTNYTHEHDCSIPENVATWTVHGIWPTDGTTEGPCNCNDSIKFDPQQVVSILVQLQEFWPNLFTDSPKNEFWQHEWSKHGTCAMALPSLSTQLKYFSKGLELRQQYDLLSLLQNSDIVPRDEPYKYSDFVSALTKGLGAKPVLYCFYNKKEKMQFIMEVDFCMDKSFNIMECPTKTRTQVRGTHSNANLYDNVISMVQKKSSPEFDPMCRDDEDIYYPVIRHA